MKLAPGALVRCGNFADTIWTIRCRAERSGYWHLLRRNLGQSVLTTKVAKDGELELVRPAPTFKVGETVKHQGRECCVLEDQGDFVAIAVGLSKIEVSKAELVIERL